MHILVLGGGGREHAIIKALKASPKVKQLSVAPGNPGMAGDATCYLTDPTDSRRVLDLAKRLNCDLIIVGPEAPLATGVSDALRSHGYQVFGPSAAAAQLETSKIFSKNFMKKNEIPTARAVVCQSKEELLKASQDFPKPWVVKADGLASGKGVRICHSPSELEECAADFFDKKTLGNAASQVLLEEHLPGDEVSLLLLVANKSYGLLPLCQDYKRLLEKNKGPNTGGMGSYAPVKINSALMKKFETDIIAPTIKGLTKDNLDYRGVLYIGLMVVKGQPYVLEYNVRFGDPEAQVLLPLLEGDWAKTFLSVAENKVPKLKWSKQAAVCVVIAAPGYPDNPQKGLRITLDKEKLKSSQDKYLLHASTAAHQGYLTNGGRVLNSVGVAKTIALAREKAYKTIQAVHFENMHYRRDIANLKSKG